MCRTAGRRARSRTQVNPQEVFSGRPVPMAETANSFQLVFLGLKPGTSEAYKSVLAARLVESFRMSPVQAESFLQIRNAIIQSSMPQAAAFAVSGRLQGIGLNVVAVPVP